LYKHTPEFETVEPIT